MFLEINQMCGIVGLALNEPNVTRKLLDGLHRLEYRGYDSAGVAVHVGDRMQVVRALGKLYALESALDGCRDGSVGIGHTRWATHGAPSKKNAHPIRSGKTVVVHNGIVENNAELREQLRTNGSSFTSETDTEVIAHLIERERTRGRGPIDAVRHAVSHVHGVYAIAVMWDDEPRTIVCARKGSPLVVGQGIAGSFCASDAVAVLDHGRDLVFLEDGDCALLTGDSCSVFDSSGHPKDLPIKKIEWSAAAAERGGFKHFMLKEIHEQPEAIAATLAGRIDSFAKNSKIVTDELGIDLRSLASVKRIYLLACGTSYHACMIAAQWVEQFHGIPARAELASEAANRDSVFFSTDLVLAVSQSGETFDTLAAASRAKAMGARVVAVTNSQESALARLADETVLTRAGPEISVASTKCFTAQMTALCLVVASLEHASGRSCSQMLEEIKRVPELLARTLERVSEQTEQAARALTRARGALYLGRGVNYPLALEGALKAKEIAYVSSEGYAGGEMKHGPIALLDRKKLVAAVCPRDRWSAKTISNIHEARARSAKILLVRSEGVVHGDKHDTEIVVPDSSEFICPFLFAAPLQLLAYFAADELGLDVDQPRNLAKSVTVE